MATGANSGSSYLNLVEAVRHKELFAIKGYGYGLVTAAARWRGEMHVGPADRDLSKVDWGMPNIEFGHSFDRLHPDWIGSQLYDQLLDEGNERLSRSGHFLPHRSCAYLFHCVEDEEDYDRTYCLVLQETNTVVQGLTFIRQRPPSGHIWDRWIMDCASFKVGSQGVTLDYGVAQPHAPRDAIDMLTRKTTQMIDDAIVATMLVMSRL